MQGSLVVMGVSGCGKSTLAEAVAQLRGLPFVEGDAHHPPANLDKMREGIALTDADRAGWLATLADELSHAGAVVLSCSALKRCYRDQLRQAAPGLRFVFMDLSRGEAQRRVAARGAAHFFHAGLVDNQFDTLERPDGELGVLRVDATAPLPHLLADVSAWIDQEETTE